MLHLKSGKLVSVKCKFLVWPNRLVGMNEEYVKAPYWMHKWNSSTLMVPCRFTFIYLVVIVLLWQQCAVVILTGNQKFTGSIAGLTWVKSCSEIF